MSSMQGEIELFSHETTKGEMMACYVCKKEVRSNDQLILKFIQSTQPNGNIIRMIRILHKGDCEYGKQLEEIRHFLLRVSIQRNSLLKSALDTQIGDPGKAKVVVESIGAVIPFIKYSLSFPSIPFLFEPTLSKQLSNTFLPSFRITNIPSTARISMDTTLLSVQQLQSHLSVIVVIPINIQCIDAKFDFSEKKVEDAIRQSMKEALQLKGLDRDVCFMILASNKFVARVDIIAYIRTPIEKLAPIHQAIQQDKNITYHDLQHYTEDQLRDPKLRVNDSFVRSVVAPGLRNLTKGIDEVTSGISRISFLGKPLKHEIQGRITQMYLLDTNPNQHQPHTLITSFNTQYIDVHQQPHFYMWNKEENIAKSYETKPQFKSQQQQQHSIYTSPILIDSELQQSIQSESSHLFYQLTPNQPLSVL